MTELRSVPLSLLDLAPVSSSGDTTEALQHTIEIARHAEDLGFTRFWVAEHHGMPGIASSAPAVLIGAIASATSRIRVGSGGVMLPNHAPLVVAEQFGTLAALYPARIDLGLGRAPGTDPRTMAALRRTTTMEGPNAFPEALGELACFLADEFPEGHPYQKVLSVPRATRRPPIWLLGSSLYSAELAGLLGLPFAFAHHFSSGNTVAAFQRYQESFRSGRALDEPYSMVAVQTVCAETDEEAQRLALPAALSFLRLRQGQPGPLPSVEEAAEYPWTPLEREFVRERWEGQAVGSPETVRDALADLLEKTGASELMLTTQLYDLDRRRESLTRVRQLFGDLPVGLQQV
ncbi:MAG TPA: LLM class flavin-dependent oxidoreductase [Jatrophihabitans sp.]